MWGKCKVCAEKDNRISDLKKEIEFLKRLSSPSPTIPLLDIEASKILEGASEPVSNIEEEVRDLSSEESIEQEASNILMGNY